MSSPKIDAIGLSLRLAWSEWNLVIMLDRFHESSRGQIQAELLATTSAPGYAPHLAFDQLNLISLRARKDFAKRMAEIYPEPNWHQVMEQVCLFGVRHCRQDEPVLLLTAQSQVEAPTFSLAPLVYNNLPSVLYGPGGVGKSYLALLCAMLVEAGARVARLEGKRSPTLFMDYESDEADLVDRANRIRMGHPDLYQVELHYLRCHLPIADNLAVLSRKISEWGIKLLIIDSMAAACGAELERAETAIKLFAALRSLRVGALILAHVPKNAEEKSIYGSVFFSNFARSTWEMKKVQEPGEMVTRVGLYHRKANLGPLLPPLGLRLVFGSDAVRFEALDLTDEPTLAESLSLSTRLKAVLKDGGKTVKELADELDSKVPQIRARLSEGQGKWCTALGDGRWGLLQSV